MAFPPFCFVSVLSALFACSLVSYSADWHLLTLPSTYVTNFVDLAVIIDGDSPFLILGFGSCFW